MPTPHLDALSANLDAVPGTVSVWYGPVGGPPRYARAADATHYAASVMKPAILAALYRADDVGRLDVDADVLVHNDFRSAADPAVSFGCRRSYDDDDTVWQRQGDHVPLRWLANRMIVGSSNLATNIVLSHVGFAAVADVWRIVGARNSLVGRGIEDQAAAAAGVSNIVTAADLAALFSALAVGAQPQSDARSAEPLAASAPPSAGSVGWAEPLASVSASITMLDALLAQEHTEDLVAGLPPGTKLAHKNGWVHGVRHSAGIIYPADAAPFVLVVCTTTPLAVNERGDEACQLVARIAAAGWADRSGLGDQRRA